MSLRSMLWALNEAPTGGDARAKVILIALSDSAHDDGTCAYPSVGQLARVSECSRRTVQEKLRLLERLGAIRRGDQTLASHIPANHRPVVWELNMDATRDRGAEPASQDERMFELDSTGESEEADGVTGSLQTVPETAREAPVADGDGNRAADHAQASPACRRSLGGNVAHDGDVKRRRGAEPAPLEEDRGAENDVQGCRKTRSGVQASAPKPKHNQLSNRERRARGQKSSDRSNVNTSTCTILGFHPNDQHRALATALGLDLDFELAKFRDKALADNRRSADWDASFRNWLRRGHELGIHASSPKPVKAPEAHHAAPHRHTAGCEHVRALVAPYRDRLSGENVDGFGTSPLSRTQQALAERLNQGMTGRQALQDLHLPVDEMDEIA